MKSNLTKLMELIKRLPEKSIDELLEKAEEIKKEVEKEEEQEVPTCPNCESENVVRNGKKKGRQRYLCRTCKKSYGKSKGSVQYKSQSGEAVWRQVIRDTINGVSIDETAESLSMHHATIFNMRHKILYGIEESQSTSPVKLSGVCEADETYILENYKGAKLPDDFWRKPRKHGAKAEKPGLSNEYICICAAVERGGKSMSTAIGRSQPGSEDIAGVFKDKISGDALVLCDGAKSYSILEKNGTCAVLNVNDDDDGFKKINNVNGYHSYIKERNRNARGFSTKYINRYNALFSATFRASEFIVDDIFKMLCDGNNRYHTAESQSINLFMA
jgi:transposase-like protein